MRKSSILFVPALAIAAFLGCSKKDEPADQTAATRATVDIAPEPPPAPLVEEKKVEKALVPLALPPGAKGARDGALIALAKLDGRTIAYTADDGGQAIHAFDVGEKKELATTPLPGRPAQMLVTKDGKLLVALRDRRAVLVMGATADVTAPLERTEAVTTAAEPLAMALSENGETLVVLSAWGHTLEAFRTETRERILSKDLAREPRAVTLSADGAHAFVSHAGAGHVSVIDLAVASADVKKVDIGMPGWQVFRPDPPQWRGCWRCLDFAVDESLAPTPVTAPRPRGGPAGSITFPSRIGRQGFALAKVSVKGVERVLVPHVAVATGDATVLTNGYGGVSVEGQDVPSELFDIDVIDATKGERATGSVASVSIENRLGEGACRLPRAAIVDPEGQRLLVSCVGNRQLFEYDATSSTPTGVVKRKVAVPDGVLGLAFDAEHHQVVAWSDFDKSVTFIPRAEPAKGASPVAPVTVAVARERGDHEKLVAAGRALFHSAGNAKIARDGRACASCHPDGRDDGLVWPTPEGPRQTITLAGRIGRGAPFGWRGQHSSLKEHMRQTMKNLHGTGLSDAEYDALEAWLVTMKGPPSLGRPLDAVEQRGRVVFEESAGCGGCHLESGGFSDHATHDVGSATLVDREKSFLAPSLRAIGETAPYFHDGRYATLEELLRKSDGKMGSTGQLSPDDFKALEAYLRTL